MAGSAVPPTRLAERTRAAVRAVLLAELTAADTRAQAAGWSRETLFEVLAARLDSAAGNACEQPDPAPGGGPGPSATVLGCPPGRPAQRPSAAEDACGQPNPAESSVADRDNPAPSRLGALSATVHRRPPGRSSAVQDREHRRDDPLEPGLVGEGGG
ncbi:hypothetical protein SAMN05421837_106368 [Amycolatopsis pretoriensis]|uniref:Uncharacterized protein n=1 Tax=Amycolatopsis pretoriensis TaxID=218821 RepID=A0A1H5R2W2_9PSEU|nr:hypothetical protein [Amycolatopsis pretoriensis]SEF32659.1 hypothetical protein SAMN05421837_106368 [Amycolatopsis pretoriensis]